MYVSREMEVSKFRDSRQSWILGFGKVLKNKDIFKFIQYRSAFVYLEYTREIYGNGV